VAAPVPAKVARFRDALYTIYDQLEAAIAQHGPKCALSGRCCRFAEFGHTLFLSGLEAAVLIVDAPPPVRPLDDGQTCPWQDDHGHCTARDARPLGCRVFYCEPTYQETAANLTERFLGDLKRLADSLELTWNYAPLHQHLRQARTLGWVGFPEFEASADPSHAVPLSTGRHASMNTRPGYAAGPRVAGSQSPRGD
jgi:hypothetical protein